MHKCQLLHEVKVAVTSYVQTIRPLDPKNPPPPRYPLAHVLAGTSLLYQFYHQVRDELDNLRAKKKPQPEPQPDDSEAETRNFASGANDWFYDDEFHCALVGTPPGNETETPPVAPYFPVEEHISNLLRNRVSAPRPL